MAVIVLKHLLCVSEDFLQDLRKLCSLCRSWDMVDVASASAGLVQALKGNDTDNLLAAIQAGLVFQDKPGDDRQRLRGKHACKCAVTDQISIPSRY